MTKSYPLVIMSLGAVVGALAATGKSPTPDSLSGSVATGGTNSVSFYNNPADGAIYKRQTEVTPRTVETKGAQIILATYPVDALLLYEDPHFLGTPGISTGDYLSLRDTFVFAAHIVVTNYSGVLDVPCLENVSAIPSLFKASYNTRNRGYDAVAQINDFAYGQAWLVRNRSTDVTSAAYSTNGAISFFWYLHAPCSQVELRIGKQLVKVEMRETGQPYASSPVWPSELLSARPKAVEPRPQTSPVTPAKPRIVFYGGSTNAQSVLGRLRGDAVRCVVLGGADGLKYSTDGKWLSPQNPDFETSGPSAIYSIENMQRVIEPPSYDTAILRGATAKSLSPDASLLVVRENYRSGPGGLRVYRFSDMKEVCDLGRDFGFDHGTGHWAPDGRSFWLSEVTPRKVYSVTQWSAETGREMSRMTLPGAIRSIDPTSGMLICAASGKGTITLVSTGNSDRVVIEADKAERHSGGWALIRDIALSPRGGAIATCGRTNVISLWSTITGQRLQSFVGHTGEVTCLSFEPGGARLVSVGYDETMKWWDVSTGALLGTFKLTSRPTSGVYPISSMGLAISPDETSLALTIATGMGLDNETFLRGFDSQTTLLVVFDYQKLKLSGCP